MEALEITRILSTGYPQVTNVIKTPHYLAIMVVRRNFLNYPQNLRGPTTRYIYNSSSKLIFITIFRLNRHNLT